MLLPVSIRLDVLEVILNNAMLEITQEMKEITYEGDEIASAMKSMDAKIRDDKNRMVSNPDFVESYNRLEEIRQQIRALSDEREETKRRVKELEDIEADNQRRNIYFRKNENHYAATLNDLIKLRTTEEKIKAIEESLVANG